MLCSLCRTISNIMASDGSNLMKMQMHIKQHLNAFHEIDQLVKTLTNDDNHMPRWMSQCDHLNTDGVIDDIK